MLTTLPTGSLRIACAVLLAGSVGLSTTTALDVKVDPRATYLHTNQDSALDASAIVLASAGVTEGGCVHLERLGDWDNGPGGDTFTSLIGVLSRSAILLAGTERYRVQDAVDAGMDHTTPATYYGSQPTDIPEDFAISYDVNGVDLLIPAGAAYLFVTPNDQLWRDNSDPDADFQVRIVALVPWEVSAAGSIEPLEFLDRETLRWEDVALNCADTYNVYRGEVRNLPLRDYGSCWRTGIATNTTVDPDVPANGRSWFYLVTAKNAVGEGPLGNDSAESPRIPAVACP